MKITKCRICGNEDLRVFLDLGDQPWCNDFVLKCDIGHERRYPLQVCFCNNCTTVQINYSVPPETMYSNHLYLSGSTKTMKLHFDNIADKVCNMMGHTGKVLDIGSNDGTLLSTYQKRGMTVLGVDPCKHIANIAVSNGIPTKVDFFGDGCSEELLFEEGKFNIISAANVFYHIEDLHGITVGVKRLLDEDGVFVMHGSYLPMIMKQKAFDIMYHEHLLYYRVFTLQYLMNLHGMEIFDINITTVHGGSIVAFIGHKGSHEIQPIVPSLLEEEIQLGMDKIDTYISFANDISNLKNDIFRLVSDLKEEGNTIYAFGAPAKGTVLLNYCGINNGIIDYATEVNSLKFDRYIPCTGIQIVDEATTQEPDYYLMLSWNFAEEFKKSPKFLDGNRKFIVPVPEPRIIKS